MFATTMAADANGAFPGFAMDDAGTPATVSSGAVAELTTSLRRAARALAGDAGHRNDRAAVAEATRPIVAAIRAELRDWRRQGSTGQQVACVWSRMVDAAVVEAYRMARFQSGQTSIVAPLTVVAVGAYGEHELRPERPVQLLLVVPADRRELAGRRMARHLTQNLRAFGLSVSATVSTGGDNAYGDARSAVLLATGRVLAGSETLWTGRNAAHTH